MKKVFLPREKYISHAFGIFTRENHARGRPSIWRASAVPWSWELTTGENPVYPHTDPSCYHVGGTQGSVTVPKLDIWFNEHQRGWWEPIRTERVPVTREDPLLLQVQQFCRVIRGQEQPLVSGPGLGGDRFAVPPPPPAVRFVLPPRSDSASSVGLSPPAPGVRAPALVGPAPLLCAR